MNKYIRSVMISFIMVSFLGEGFSAPLDMTIKGKARDKVTIERVVPEADVPLKNVIPFSRLGQTDWILSEELGYLGEEKQISMMNVRSPKVYKPSMIQFPKPPYFVQTYPPPPEPIIVDRRPKAPPLPGEQERWTFIVIDQNNKLLKKIEGNTPPVEPIQWDGMSRGRFLLRTDEIYSSILIIQENPDTPPKHIVGEPVWLPALRYLKNNNLMFEFSNKRVYNEQRSDFSPALQVLVDQLMNALRKHEGAPFTVKVYGRDLELAQQRAKMWRAFLERNLLRHAEEFKVQVSPPGERGEVTQVVVAVTR
ncbi:hypothetical protein BVX98_00850 [bacterium F11]|nr:hypothetical protein BVX98_00850 [bacterium F11]